MYSQRGQQCFPVIWVYRCATRDAVWIQLDPLGRRLYWSLLMIIGYVLGSFKSKKWFCFHQLLKRVVPVLLSPFLRCSGWDRWVPVWWQLFCTIISWPPETRPPVRKPEACSQGTLTLWSRFWTTLRICNGQRSRRKSEVDFIAVYCWSVSHKINFPSNFECIFFLVHLYSPPPSAHKPPSL